MKFYLIQKCSLSTTKNFIFEEVKGVKTIPVLALV